MIKLSDERRGHIIEKIAGSKRLLRIWKSISKKKAQGKPVSEDLWAAAKRTSMKVIRRGKKGPSISKNPKYQALMRKGGTEGLVGLAKGTRRA